MVDQETISVSSGTLKTINYLFRLFSVKQVTVSETNIISYSDTASY